MSGWAESFGSILAGIRERFSLPTVLEPRSSVIPREAPPPGPTYPLADDPQAAAVLRRLARKPWDEPLWQVLADRALELGRDVTAAHVRAMTASGWSAQCRRLPRRGRQRMLRWWRLQLARLFGDFENTT